MKKEKDLNKIFNKKYKYINMFLTMVKTKASNELDKVDWAFEDQYDPIYKVYKVYICADEFLYRLKWVKTHTPQNLSTGLVFYNDIVKYFTDLYYLIGPGPVFSGYKYDICIFNLIGKIQYGMFINWLNKNRNKLYNYITNPAKSSGLNNENQFNNIKYLTNLINWFIKSVPSNINIYDAIIAGLNSIYTLDENEKRDLYIEIKSKSITKHTTKEYCQTIATAIEPILYK